MQAVEIPQPYSTGPRAQFFVTIGYRAPGSPDDEVVLATVDGAIVGAVRLAREDDTLVLRGVQIDEHWRGKGLGRRLLAAVAQHTARETSFVIPLAHLEAFYAQAGWVRVERDVPEFLVARVQRYREVGDAVFVARREGVSP